MSIELKKIGASIVEGDEFLEISPPLIIRDAEIDTYDDHRMAMCFSLVSLKKNLVIINDPECVKKTYPNYFHDFEKIML